MGKIVNSAVTLRPSFVVDVVNVTVIPSEGGGVGELGELEVWVDIYGRVGVTPVPPSISSLAVKEMEPKNPPRSFVLRILRGGVYASRYHPHLRYARLS